jgi:hypothetical protein
MHTHRLILPFAASLMAACTFQLFKPAAPAETRPVSAAEMSKECSSLRADIASARYKQRSSSPATGAPNAAPTTAPTVAPMIAEAAAAKEDQKIDDMQQRYDSLGCALTAPEPAAGKP